MSDKPYRRSSIYLDGREILTLDSLLRQLEDFQDTITTGTLHRLENENAVLKQQLSYYEQNWRASVAFLSEGLRTAMSTRTALEAYQEAEGKAEQEWLAFWGISMKPTSALAYRSMEWPEVWI
ncbi:hypothetical protein UCRPC4_g00115 [Phaeomoniella chlamydospora]|uniref:Uncharacterized protein n=1 Tax=Phaeomoniella chlamydospora TaxID=158046 RepID=A0A0G2F4N6_PHACM|nr:hypothetical protein UCRPC4_g00115 [Phaeomoniella chlamydospora]